MMVRIVAVAAVSFAVAVAVAGAAQHPIFDLDDAVDARQHLDPVFISRLAGGGGTNLTDDYRPLRKAGGFFQLTNSLYWKQIQLDYKRSRVFNNGDKIELKRCSCQRAIEFPTPPSTRSTPQAPPQSAKHTMQFGFYYSV